MGVYIKNLEMPTGCGALDLKIWPDSQVEIIDADGEWKTSEAIFVPAHGRLGDLDALTISTAVLLDGKPYRYAHIDNIENAPTIIPAEEEN